MVSNSHYKKIDLSQMAGEYLSSFVRQMTIDALACGDRGCLALLHEIYRPIRYNRSTEAQHLLAFATSIYNSLTKEQLDILGEPKYSPTTRHAAEIVADFVINEITDTYPANSDMVGILTLRSLVAFFETLNSLLLFFVYGGRCNMTTNVVFDVLNIYKERLKYYEEQANSDAQD